MLYVAISVTIVLETLFYYMLSEILKKGGNDLTKGFIGIIGLAICTGILISLVFRAVKNEIEKVMSGNRK